MNASRPAGLVVLALAGVAAWLLLRPRGPAEEPTGPVNDRAAEPHAPPPLAAPERPPTKGPAKSGPAGATGGTTGPSSPATAPTGALVTRDERGEPVADA